MPIQPPRPSAAEIVRAEPIASGLHPRTFGRAGMGERRAWRLVLLEQGEGTFRIGADTFGAAAPCLTWQPWGIDDRLTVVAGTVGAQVLIGSAVLAGAIGEAPEAPELRFVADRRAHLPLAGRPDLEASLKALMGAIRSETGAGRPGARTAVEALLRLLLIRFWREQGAPALPQAGAVAARYLSRFQSLIEAHFRDRWTVARYAAELGISADRLTDICRRGRGRTPRQLLAERTCAEARYLLDRSLHSVEQVAGLLGFASAAHFGRFFKAEAGLTPGQYRRRPAPQAEPEGRRMALSEWP